MTELSTGDDRVYQILPFKQVPNGGESTLIFDVKCRNDAHIVLLGSETVAPPMIEVFIGGWRNQKSAIRHNQSQPDKAVAATSGIVSELEYRRFWIRFSTHSVSVGNEGESEPFLNWDNIEDPFEVTHVGFATGWGSTGSWIIDDESGEEVKSPESCCLSEEEDDPEKIRQRGKRPFYKRPGIWLDVKDGQMPLRAVMGGRDATGEKIYVGRTKHDGALLTGKIVPSHQTCYVACDGVEQGSSTFEVLVRNKYCELVWIPANHGDIPLGALQGGFTADKKPVFIGRVVHDGATTIGTVCQSRRLCSCPYGGEELCQTDYEVLVVKFLPI